MTMKAEELKTKSADELVKTLLDLKKQQFNLRVQRSQGQLERTNQIGVVRRDIARVKTIMHEKQRAEAAGAAPAPAPAKSAKAAKAAPAKAKKTAAKKSA